MTDTGTESDTLEVSVHPLVLLSVVDHYNRVAKDTRKRVVGVLLGSRYKSVVDITNCFAVPFEEDPKDPQVWFLDHNYLESMAWMFKRVNSREDIVGFYSSGPKVMENDLKIDNLLRRFCHDPVFVIIDIRPDLEGIPIQSYMTVSEVDPQENTVQRRFRYISSTIFAEESEEVGVEHLLRDINDPTVGTISTNVHHKSDAIRNLQEKLALIEHYLEVCPGNQLSHQIMYNLQEIINLLPNISSPTLQQSLQANMNGFYLLMYLSSLGRSITALHGLINNKIAYKEYAGDDDLVK